MTPPARVAAAIEILDAILDGAPAEQALLRWSRRSRYAGSKDREAVRDHVFDALRRRRSAARLGGAETGRGLLLGLLRQAGDDPLQVFGADRYAPSALTESEADGGTTPTGSDALDVPDWVLPGLQDSLGTDMAAILECQRYRAPVWIRVCTHRIARDALAGRLLEEGIETEPASCEPTALRVTAGARKLHRSPAWSEGLFEMQDLASQAVCAALPLAQGDVVLDYCAGGGGKALAIAARTEARVLAYDVSPKRMADLPTRAARARADVVCLGAPDLQGLDPVPLVLVDAPCSGSGTWARTPDSKWRLTPEALAALTETQDAILAEASAHVHPGGALAYVTCSLFTIENEDRVSAFLSTQTGWTHVLTRRWTPLDGGDGFFLAVLRRSVSHESATFSGTVSAKAQC